MQTAYRHEALPYAGPDEFLSSCVDIAEAGRAQDARVIFLVAASKVTALRKAMNGAADDVALVAIDQHGRNPSRIAAMLDSFQATSNGQPCIGVNESVFAGRSPIALAEAQFAESVLNSAQLESWPLSVFCLYDTGALDAPALNEMRRSHPYIRGEDSNDRYEPGLAAAAFALPLDPPPDGTRWRHVSGDELAITRNYVRDEATAQRLAADRVEDLVLAANEIVTNSLRHGNGDCRIAIWHDPESVVCEVRDAGRIADPLLGRLAPSPGALRGRGLWLANHLCDLVQIRSGANGTVVRLRVDYVS